MTYLLDTNAVIALLTNRYPGVRTQMARALAAGSRIAVSTIVLVELWYGIARSERRDDDAEGLRRFLAGDVMILPFEAQDAQGRRRFARRAGERWDSHRTVRYADRRPGAPDRRDACHRERGRVRSGAQIGLGGLGRDGVNGGGG